MPNVHFDAGVFGELSDALCGTEHLGPQKKAALGFACMRQLDGLGKDLPCFVANVADPAFAEALQEAILCAKDQRFKFRKPVRLYELIREIRNRYSRVNCGTHTQEDAEAIVRFGNSIRQFGKTAAAA